MHPHLARDMAQDDVTILQLHPERRIGQRFQDLALHLNSFFFRHSFTSREAAHSISRLPSREKRKGYRRDCSSRRQSSLEIRLLEQALVLLRHYVSLTLPHVIPGDD